MKMKYISLMVLVLFITGIISSSVFGQDEEMRKTTTEHMKAWVESFSPEQFNQLGYKDKAEFDKSELGTPYMLYTIDPNKLVNFDSPDEFEGLLLKTEYMIFPVILEGRNKSLLWMYRKDREMKIARIGSTELSKKMKVSEEVIQKYREERGLGSPHFVRIYQLYLDFFYVNGNEEAFVVPMQTLPDLNIKGNTFYPVKELLPVLQEELKKKMPFKDNEGRIKEY